MKRLVLGAIVLLTAIGPTVAQTPSASNDWEELRAYTLGVQAYIYSYPYVYLPELRYQWVTKPVDPENVPYAPLNHFWHSNKLITPEYQNGGTPNNDTLYSEAWVDISKEPVILSVPDMGTRYYAIEMGGMDSDNFDYVGQRTTGTKAGNYAIVGPGWKGQLPKGVKLLQPSPTPFALFLARTFVSGSDDVPVALKLMAQYKITPLSLWGKPDAKAPEDRKVLAPFDRKSDPLADWKTINATMAENPPPAKHQILLTQFAQIGVGPGIDVDKLDDPTKRGLARAAVDGRKLLENSITAGAGTKRVNGWKYPPPDMGRAGQHEDFLLRGGLQCMWGIITHDVAEAVYLNSDTDSDGQPLSGATRYSLTFPPGGLPKVKSFWSLTIYDANHNLIANPLNRYSIGDRTKGLKQNPDGSITLYVQNESPGADKESNWLPAPKGGFNLTLRAYSPGQEIIEQSWIPPQLKAGN